ncbi:MAG: GxxExxY protein, partial [Gemmatimonadaceae bacterium]
MKEESLTRQVIGCFFTAYNELTFGLPESVYSTALQVLFRDVGLDARREHGVDVMFRNTRVGTFRVDYLIEDTLILEIKAGHKLPSGSKAQLLNYLR